MFRCDVTHECSKPGEKMFKVVAQTRLAQHFELREGVPVHVASGTQIVCELRCTAAGAKLWAEMDETAKAELLGKGHEKTNTSVRSAA